MDLGLIFPELKEVNRRVPYLHEEAFQWYESFDQLGELLAHPNPTPAIECLTKTIEHLVRDCHWTNIHLFGFAQGGSVAAEFGIGWWRTGGLLLRSIVTVGGPLLSYPTLHGTLCPTPVMVFHRPQEDIGPNALAWYRKGFVTVRESGGEKGGRRHGMPSSKDEWAGIMEFWSERLARRTAEGVYEVLSGGPAPDGRAQDKL